MRWLAALPALLLAVPAAAQEKPDWAGVWAGRVGTYPVRLCIDVWGDQAARGAYYYLSQLEPIALTEQDGEGGWVELAPGGEATALWEFAEQTGLRLRGTWRQGGRSLAFELSPVPWTETEWGGSCNSAAFSEKRVGGGRIVSEAASRAGWRYTRQLYRPAAHFADDVKIESFNFPPEQPGDRAINVALRAYLPREDGADDFVQCTAANIAANGHDGFYDLLLEPRLVSRRYLTVLEAHDQTCGGLSPSTWSVHRTFDRQTGKPVDIHDWVGAPAASDGNPPLPGRLRSAILARWPDDDREDCVGVVSDTDFWNLELTGEGISFTPDLPRVVMACGDTVLLTWRELAPFLDAEGRAGLARLRGD